jgi:hypothetical protein
MLLLQQLITLFHAFLRLFQLVILLL